MKSLFVKHLSSQTFYAINNELKIKGLQFVEHNDRFVKVINL